MAQLGFGSGSIWNIPLGSNKTPTRLGVIQNIGIDFKASVKSLYGQNQLPVDNRRGTMAINGKGEFSQISARFYNDIFFGDMSTATTGQNIPVDNELSIIPSSPYTITVVNSSTFTTDLGVIYADTGLPLTRVSSTPATGQYSVSNGVYTFASADTTLSVKISYIYTLTSGETIKISNIAMGVQPKFKTVFLLPDNQKKFAMTLNSCISESISINTSLEDYTKQPFSFMASVDASDTLGTISFAEAM